MKQACYHYMLSLQLCLHQSWNRVDQSTRVPWSQDCLRNLRWWLHLPCFSQGVSLRQVSPDLNFWSDASDVGWGAHLGLLTASGLWSQEESQLSINARELLAVRRGLLHFQSSLVGKIVSVLRQQHGDVLPPQGGRHEVSFPEFSGAARRCLTSARREARGLLS